MTIVHSAINYHAGNQSQTVTSILVTAFRQISDLLKQQYLQKRQYQKNQRVLSQLLNFEDNILADIGITRADVIWAKNLPIEFNATIELENISRN